MLRILTLGGLAATSTDRSPQAARARLQGLGLLARLAVAGERGLSRDKLVAYFWPDRDERSALHSLSQALHRLRADLGEEALFEGTRILRLNPNHVSSDVGDLEAAHRAGDDTRVADLYVGPFLDGIYFEGAPDFERWIDEERRRIAGVHASALRRLGAAASAREDHAAAAKWLQRLLATDPLDGRIAWEVIQALDAAGDDAGALREARLHRSLVRTELQRDADRRIVDFVERIERREPARTTVRVTVAAAPDHADDVAGLTADQLCARARQRFFSFTADGIAEGVRYAQRAIDLDPGQALSHVTLAWLYILQSQAFDAHALRARATACALRARELDPRLADGPLALGWIAHLDERFDEAEALAQEGVALDPAYSFAHMVLGWAHLNHGLRMGRWDKCAKSVASLRTTLSIQPRDPHAVLALSALHVAAGRYDEARAFLERAMELETAPVGEVPMIASITLLGMVQMRRREIAESRASLERAAATYAGARQIFAPYVNALTHCALGDLERFAGRHDEAVTHYVRARGLLDITPGLIGNGYLAVRLETRLAGAFRTLRMRPGEERHAQAAARLTSTRKIYAFNWCWGVSEGEMYYDWAVYHAIRADRTALLETLRRAADFGWRETAMLGIEPAFAAFRQDPELQRLAAEIDARPTLDDEGVKGGALSPRDEVLRSLR